MRQLLDQPLPTSTHLYKESSGVRDVSVQVVPVAGVVDLEVAESTEAEVLRLAASQRHQLVVQILVLFARRRNRLDKLPVRTSVRLIS